MMRLIGLAVTLAALMLAIGAGQGRPATEALRRVRGVSLDWRDVANGEQLMVGKHGAILAVEFEHAPFLLGSQVEFESRPVACVPASAHTCFVKKRWIGAYGFRPVQTRVTIRAVLLKEATDSVTVAALAYPVGQPRLIFTFQAAANTLATAHVHAGGPVLVRLRRVKGGAVGPERTWNPYSWIATSIREL